MIPAEDPFSILGLEPRPFPDPESIRASYFRLAADLHPDKPGGDATRFATLNRARQHLLSHPRRLRFLAGNAPASAPPAELFGEVAAAVTSSRSALRAAGEATSPLARALAASSLANTRRLLDACGKKLTAELDARTSRLRRLDAAWPDVPASDLAALATDFTFLERWITQINECLLETDGKLTETKCPDGARAPRAP